LGQRWRASSLSNLVSLGLLSDNHDNLGDTSLTAGAAAAKGAWVEMVDPSLRRYNWLDINIHNNNTTNIYMIDIGTGAAASEVVIIPDILHHIDLAVPNIIEIIHQFKVNVPAATRISARVSSVLATDTIDVNVIGTG